MSALRVCLLHYITDAYVTLHYIMGAYVTLHYIMGVSVTLHYECVCYITLWVHLLHCYNAVFNTDDLSPSTDDI